MASVEMFEDIVAQGFGNYWSVVKHDHWASRYQGLSVGKVINNLLVPIFLLVRYTCLNCFVQQLVFITAKTGCL